MTVRRGACCLEGELTILQVEPDRDSCNMLHAHMLNIQRTTIISWRNVAGNTARIEFQ